LSAHFIRLYDRVPVLRLQGKLVIQELLDVECILWRKTLWFYNEYTNVL
jgi:hypothetical protein